MIQWELGMVWRNGSERGWSYGRENTSLKGGELHLSDIELANLLLISFSLS